MSGSSIRSTREIGPLGTLSRVALGVTAVVVPIALEGFTVTEAVIAFVGLTLVALVAGAAIEVSVRRCAPAVFRSRLAISSAPSCLLIAVLVLANDGMVAPTTANGNVTIFVWFGVSLLVAAARGYSGCEVLAVPNLLTDRRSQIGCLLYSPIDQAEARRRQRTTTDRMQGRT